MAKRGKCVNIDCDHYKEEFDIQAGEEFECPYCHKPLSDAEGKGKDSKKKDNGKGLNWKLIGGIAAAILVLGGLGYGGYVLYDSHQQSEQEKAEALAAAEEAEAQLEEKEEEEAERLAREEKEARIKAINENRRNAVAK